ncbi:pilus assembly FimT family protein, partial [Escherichia coli]|uniref:pilus assembly FimT family protein n=1 Tax=Escherichia coli TaxID=562 RepID=UPI0019539B0D
VLGVILAVAAPSLRDLMERRRVIAAATELASMINYAKAEAAKQRGGGSDNGFTLHLEPPDDASTSCVRLTTT